MDKFDWLRRITEEQYNKEYTRRDLLKKIPKATAFLLGSAFLTNEAIQRYIVNTDSADSLDESLRYDSTQVNPPKPTITPKYNIFAENQKPGSRSWTLHRPAPPTRLQGYASKDSVQHGDTITFFVHSKNHYRIEIYRMGYYHGLGARHMVTISDLKPSPQNLKPNTQTQEAVNWTPSYTLRVPADWVPGAYLCKLIDENGYESYMIFVVREQNPTADFAVLLATNTYQAYDNWGGKSLYGYNSTGGKQARMVSFNRPHRNFHGAGLFFQFEYNLVRWLEKEGYALTYICDMDLHEQILDRSHIRTLLIAGHSEYWSMEMRQSVEKWSASKINLAVFSANCAYWQVRMEPDAHGNPNRLMVSYKQFATQEDPIRFTDPHRVTTRWRDQPVNMPEDRMFGIMYAGIPEAPAPLVVTNAKHWLYEGTGLKNGDKIPGVVGGEVDLYCGKLPGVEVIASSPVMLYGKRRYANVAWYQKPMGGKVFAVGSFYWNWFLDPIHYKNRAHENKAIQQITRNALNELKK